MRLIAILWFALLMATSANASELKELSSSDSKDAIVLVGGFGNDYSYFAPWMGQMQATQHALFGFAHDHRATSMEDGARDLASELRRLSDQGIRTVTLLAHSMGGLVAHRALLLLGEDASRFDFVVFRAYGTPWGGYRSANFIGLVPFAKAVARAMGFPMSADIGSRSEFMLSLRKPLARNVRFVVYEGSDDSVARPTSDSAIEQYNSVLAKASHVSRLSHVDHDSFVTAIAFAL